MWVERLDVVRVSYGLVSVSGSGSSIWPGLAAQLLGGHQPDGRLDALAHLTRRAAHDVADRRALDADRRAARRLHPLQQHAQAGAARLLGVADGRRRRVEALLEVHVVHDLAGGEGVAVAQQVPAAQLERADVQLGGERVHRALRRPHRLHRPVAAEGAVRRQVRVDRERVDADVRDQVGPDAGVAELGRDAGAAVRVRARVDPAVELLGDQRAVPLRADPHAHRRRVAVERDELLRAVEHGLDRPAGLARERGDQRLEPHERLRPERAAHRRSDHPDVVLGDAECDARCRHAG